MTAATPEQTLAGEARDLVGEAGELGCSIARLLLGSARAAGLDPAMHAPLTGAALILGASQITVYTAEGQAHPDDICFLADVSDAEDDARDLLTATRDLARKTGAARDAALADLEDAHDDAAPRAAAAGRLDLCQRTFAVLTELERRLQHAITRLQAVPVVLGETYESVYSLIRAGGLMPTEGRWITGEDPAWPSARRRNTSR
jgi:hypothetical protein